jgi:hypothetical protein
MWKCKRICHRLDSQISSSYGRKDFELLLQPPLIPNTGRLWSVLRHHHDHLHNHLTGIPIKPTILLGNLQQPDLLMKLPLTPSPLQLPQHPITIREVHPKTYPHQHLLLLLQQLLTREHIRTAVDEDLSRYASSFVDFAADVDARCGGQLKAADLLVGAR